MRKLRIFLADDHVVLREGLKALIDAQPDMEVVGQAGDGRAMLQQTLDCSPDLVVMDLSMPGVNGAQATAQLRQLCPDVRVVALTRHGEAGYVRQMLQSGAQGYVLKQAAAEELIGAIRSVASGGTFLDTSLAGRLVNSFVRGQTQSSVAHEQDLSEREADVVRLTALGYSNKEIATRLSLSVKTVDTYKMRAMEKLGLHSRAELVRYAIQRGWLDQA
ncbi:MAG: response regulator transcription factor [Kouleothrix sp.]|nr:response regulator transcription factor [Kouleothrix sp.]